MSCRCGRSSPCWVSRGTWTPRPGGCPAARRRGCPSRWSCSATRPSSSWTSPPRKVHSSLYRSLPSPTPLLHEHVVVHHGVAMRLDYTLWTRPDQTAASRSASRHEYVAPACSSSSGCRPDCRRLQPGSSPDKLVHCDVPRSAPPPRPAATGARPPSICCPSPGPSSVPVGRRYKFHSTTVRGGAAARVGAVL